MTWELHKHDARHVMTVDEAFAVAAEFRKRCIAGFDPAVRDAVEVLAAEVLRYRRIIDEIHNATGYLEARS